MFLVRVLLAGVMAVTVINSWDPKCYAAQSNSNQIVELTRDNIWQTRLRLTKSQPFWQDGQKFMYVTPKIVGGHIYIPTDTEDALRDLKSMLPKSYVAFRIRHASKIPCDGDKKIDSLGFDDSITEFIAAEWLKFGRSDLFGYVVDKYHIDLDQVKESSRDRISERISYSIANAVLRKFYRSEYNGSEQWNCTDVGRITEYSKKLMSQDNR